MTKEQFLDKWLFGSNPLLEADLEAVIATEIAKVQEAKPEPKYPIGGYAPGHYTCRCANCKIEFMGDKRAVQCEPCAVKTTSQPAKQPAKPFDKDRFERMFCASIGIGKFANFSDIILSVETTLQKLDAYYASKNN